MDNYAYNLRKKIQSELDNINNIELMINRQNDERSQTNYQPNANMMQASDGSTGKGSFENIEINDS